MVPWLSTPVRIPRDSPCDSRLDDVRDGQNRDARHKKALRDSSACGILARDGYRCTVHVRPGQRCESTKLLEVHHIYGGGDVLLVPDEELRTVCRKHNPTGG